MAISMIETITKFENTGPCEINLDLAINNFNTNVQITRSKDFDSGISEYRIVETTSNKKEVKSKFTISEEQALMLIKKLHLIGISDAIYKRLTVYYHPDTK